MAAPRRVRRDAPFSHRTCCITCSKTWHSESPSRFQKTSRKAAKSLRYRPSCTLRPLRLGVRLFRQCDFDFIVSDEDTVMKLHGNGRYNRRYVTERQSCSSQPSDLNRDRIEAMDPTFSRLEAVLNSCFNSGPVLEATIASAEVELGLLFPPSYRLFLSRFGASLGNGIEIYGLPPSTDPDQPPQWSDVITATVRLRPHSLPENSVEISHDGMEYGYFLQCSTSDPQFEGPVIEWGPSHDGGQVVALSFMEFLQQQLSR
ncbi:SMI1 / KNR4 family protein [Symmachiella macrocystis]|uniref:SMI1 / KNR4 family protein n=1 Tax=Symmachiella macrocystis TaxID=2527985 RepID=A0A5C6BGY9_9PLAN|nr:SMI1 / KNR4 family protein [Symmachiella macrocystis]